MKTDYSITNDGNNLVYLDINVINDSNKRIPATFTVSRASPILPDNNEEYVASIIRFTIPLTSQPLFIFFKDSNKVSIKYNGNTYTTNLLFEKTDFNTDIDYTNQFVDGGIYQYQTFANIINTAISTACTNAGISTVPYITYNSDLGKYTIFQPISWADTYPYTDISKPKLFFNNLLATYFVNFNNITYDNNQNNNNCDYLLICSNTKNNLYIDESKNQWLYNKQEWNSGQYSNSLSNITITSNLFPCAGDSLNNTRFQDNNFSSSSIKVVSDFEVVKEESGSQRSLVQYQSQNYRYIDLIGKNKLYNLDFTFYVFFNELINEPNYSPYQKLILNPYEVISLKIMFKKKVLNY